MVYTAKAEQLLQTLEFNEGGSYIFQGDKGLGKCSAAKKIIMEQCQCSEKELYCNPDVLVIEPDAGSVKIDQVRQITNFMSYLPSNAKCKYVLIDDADLMTVATQNALLKGLEECKYTVFFLIAHRQELLETIVSRSKVVKFEPLGIDEVERYLKERQSDVNRFILNLCNGHIGLYYAYLEKPFKSFREDCERIVNGIANMKSRRELFELFNCVKEKDKELFFDKYEAQEIRVVLELLKRSFYNALLAKTKQRESMDPLVCNLSHMYDGPELIKIVSKITGDIFWVQVKGAYNKNNFFDLIRYLAETE